MASQMKLVIAGSRTFNDYEKLIKEVESFLISCNLKYLSDLVIISGGAKGADSLAEKLAQDNKIKFVKFPADWNTYGRRAGYVRNVQMAEEGTHCICFWDGKSRGTKMMIDLAQEHGLITKIINLTD